MTTSISPTPRTREASRVNALVAELEPELVALRRQIHAHPELSRMEHDTTALVADRLRRAGLQPRLLPGSGLVCDIGADPRGKGRRRIALRADLDALPISEASGLPFASTKDGVSHACGHDVHTVAVLGAAVVLAGLDRAGELPIGVRVIFQPAEETQPSGAAELVELGALDGVEQIYALHCEPKVDCGKVGSRIGPITAASDDVTVVVSSPGGHTSRPHLTGDVVYALGQVITQLPAVLGRRMDPRAGVNLTWGTVHAGKAPNVIPGRGYVSGTLRCLDGRVWERAGKVLEEVAHHVVLPYDVEVEVRHERGIPPVVNDEHAVRVLDAAAKDVLDPGAVVLIEQSLGGEDFAWYLTQVPGALVRLGTRSPGGRSYDLHRGDIVFDERAIGIGARVLARTAQLAATRRA